MTTGFLSVVEDAGNAPPVAAKVLLLIATQGALRRQLIKELPALVAAIPVGDRSDCGDGIGG